MLLEHVVYSSESIHYGCHQKEAITEEVKIMTNSVNNPNKPQKINDDDLAAVTGGHEFDEGYWDESTENKWYRHFLGKGDSFGRTFDQYMDSILGGDSRIQARTARMLWKRAGSPDNCRFYIHEDGTLDRSYF